MKIEDIVDAKPVTEDDMVLLKEVFSHPRVVQYLQTLAKRTIADIAFTGITSGESAEEYVRKTLYSKGGLNVLQLLLSIAD